MSKVFSSGAKTVALDGVTLLIGSGEFTAVMGPSGSGKSTHLFADRTQLDRARRAVNRLLDQGGS